MSEPDLLVFHEPAEGDVRLPTSARVIDRERLVSIEAKVHSFCRTGCVLETRDNSDVPDYLSLRFENLDQLIGAYVTWRRGKMTGVDFETGSLPGNDLRKEARMPVNMPAVVKEPGGDWKASCVITDASRSGCRLRSDKAMSFPVDVLVNIEAVDRPIGGMVVWRRKNQVGVALSWNERRPMARDKEPFRVSEGKADQETDG